MPRSRLLSWLLRAGIVVTILCVLAVAWVFIASEWMLRRERDVPLQPLAAYPDTLPAEGERLAVIIGCWAGCHGPRGEGSDESVNMLFAAVAPTLSHVIPQYSDAELVRLIRFGVKRDNRAAIGMIPRTLYPLSDHDLSLIIAHLRRSPVQPPVPRTRRVMFKGRIALALGLWKTSADEIDPSRPRWGELPRNTPFERGRYWASVTCSECHGVDFRGNPLEGGPAMTVVQRYDLAQFTHLLRTGEPIGGRDLGLMSRVARNAFSRFTDDEIRDLHTFLSSVSARSR